MAIFEPLIICGSLSLLLIACSVFLFVLYRLDEVKTLRQNNESLSNSLEFLKCIKGVRRK